MLEVSPDGQARVFGLAKPIYLRSSETEFTMRVVAAKGNWVKGKTDGNDPRTLRKLPEEVRKSIQSAPQRGYRVRLIGEWIADHEARDPSPR